jgi:hypothetical protein
VLARIDMNWQRWSLRVASSLRDVESRSYGRGRSFRGSVSECGFGLVIGGIVGAGVQAAVGISLTQNVRCRSGILELNTRAER